MSGLQLFDDDIWTVDGPNVRDFGIMFTTRMTIVKLSNGSVWLDFTRAAAPPENTHAYNHIGPRPISNRGNVMAFLAPGSSA
jgi:hypothetical protein